MFASSDGQSRPIDEDVLYVRSYTLGTRPTFTLPLGGSGWTAGARVLAEHVWNQDSLGQALGQGYYDYEEYGGGLLLKREVGPLSTELTADRSYRDYPNYYVDGQQYTNGLDYHQLDSWWWRFGLRHRDQMSPSTLLTASLRFSVRDYTDNYVVQSDGTLTVHKQRDYGSGGDLDLAWKLAQGWGLDLGVGFDINNSNQNFYDDIQFKAEQALNIQNPYNIFTPNFEDYEDLRVDPGLHWVAAVNTWYADCSYELLLRSTGIRIQNPDGFYTDGLQADVEHGVSLDFGRILARGLRVHANLNGRDVLSNQEFAHGGALAAYSYYNGGLGLAYEWESAKL